jgi:5-methylcytosine-specific restriction endonuclease McrA
LSKVLLLNSSYEPLHICSWKRAIILLIKGKAETVERNGKKLSGGWHLPLVIRLLYYVKIPHKDIPLTRRNVMHRDNYTCQYCGKKNDLTIDHVIPRSRGGKDVWDNVVVACLRCNVSKGSRTPKEAEMDLKSKPCRPFNFIHFELSKQNHLSAREYEQWRKYLYEYD